MSAPITLKPTAEAVSADAVADQILASEKEAVSEGLPNVQDQLMISEDTSSSSCCCCFTAIQSLFEGVIACICACFRAIGETLCCLSPIAEVPAVATPAIDPVTSDETLAVPLTPAETPVVVPASSDETAPVIVPLLVTSEPVLAPTPKFTPEERARLDAFISTWVTPFNAKYAAELDTRIAGLPTEAEQMENETFSPQDISFATPVLAWEIYGMNKNEAEMGELFWLALQSLPESVVKNLKDSLRHRYDPNAAALKDIRGKEEGHFIDENFKAFIISAPELTVLREIETAAKA